MQQKDDKLKFEGQVIEALPNANFKIVLDSGKEVLGHLAGRLRIHKIRILLGDRVLIELSPYDEKRGRITRRL